MTAVAVGVVSAIAWELVYAPAPAYTRPAVGADTRYWDLPTGSRLAYRRTPAVGRPRPTPVILVHGGPGAPDADTEPVAAALAAVGFDVYAYHQLGAGLSGRLADVDGYTVARHVADLEAVRVAIGSDRVILIGGSWGGQLIANYLAAHRDRVARAVLSSPAPIWAPAYTDATRLTDAGRRDQRAALTAHPRFLLAHALLGSIGPRAAHALLPDRQIDGIFESFVARLDLRPGCGTPPEAPDDDGPAGVGFWVNAMTVRDSRRIADPRPALARVNTPVLILRAQCDYQAWAVTREYRDLFPLAALLPIDNAGHAIQEDQPALYADTVRAFLLDRPLPVARYTADQPPW